MHHSPMHQLISKMIPKNKNPNCLLELKPLTRLIPQGNEIFQFSISKFTNVDMFTGANSKLNSNV